MVLSPFYWMILTSVKSYGAYNSRVRSGALSPCHPQCRITSMHLRTVPLGQYLFWNTLIFTVIARATLLICASRWRRSPLRDWSSAAKTWPLPCSCPLMMIPNELGRHHQLCTTITNLDLRNTLFRADSAVRDLGFLYLSPKRKL